MGFESGPLPLIIGYIAIWSGSESYRDLPLDSSRERVRAGGTLPSTCNGWRRSGERRQGRGRSDRGYLARIPGSSLPSAWPALAPKRCPSGIGIATDDRDM